MYEKRTKKERIFAEEIGQKNVKEKGKEEMLSFRKERNREKDMFFQENILYHAEAENLSNNGGGRRRI